MPAGQVIGRVSVKVLPDTDGFRRQTERELNKIEKTLKLAVATRIDMSGASREFLTELRKINQRNRVSDSRKIRFHTVISTDGMRETISDAVRKLNVRAADRKIKLGVTLAVAAVELDREALKKVTHDLEEWRRDRDPLKISVRPELVLGITSAVNQRLNYMARPRTVPFLPIINNAAAAKVATTLAALSGARVLHKYFDRVRESIAKLDKSVPIIGTLALAVAGLSGWGLTAASNLFALSASLAQIGPLALLLPGLVGGLAIGLGATFAVFKDFNAVLPKVKAQLSSLQDVMSEEFWSQAKAPISELIDTLLPRFISGLKATSDQLGGFFAGLATSITGSLNPLLDGMFADLASSIDIATASTGSLANIIAVLGSVGAGSLPELAQWFTNITDRFSAFLTKANSDGSLQGWIDAGLIALSDLGRVLSNLGGILAGIARAASAGGGSSLGMLADTLERVHKVVDSPAFQSTLVAVLVAAHQAMANLASVAGPGVTQFFETLANVLTTILPSVGTAIGTLLDSLGKALSNPAMVTGVLKMFEGLTQAVQELAPLFDPLATAIGSIMLVVAEMLPIFARLITTAFTPLAAAVVTLAPAIISLVAPLNEILTSILVPLGPVLAFVASALALIAPAIVGILNTLGPLIPYLLAAFVAWKLITTGLSFAGLIADLIETILIKKMYATESIASAAKAAAAWVASSARTIASLALTAAGFVIIGAQMVASMIATVASVVAGWVMMGVQSLLNAAKMAAAWLIAMGPIALVIAAVIGLVIIIIKNWDTIWAATVKVWNAIVSAVSGAVSGVINFVKSHWKLILGILTGPIGAALIYIISHWDKIKSVFSSGASKVIGYVKEIPGKILGYFSNVGSLLLGAGRDLIRGFIDGITGAFGSVKDKLGELTGKLTSWKGPESLDRVLLVDAGRLIIDGLITGLESRYDAVRKSLGGLTAEIGGTDITPPSVGGARGLNGVIAGALSGSLAGSAGGGKTLNYYAAPGSSIDSEEDLFNAANRARMVGW